MQLRLPRLSRCSTKNNLACKAALAHSRCSTSCAGFQIGGLGARIHRSVGYGNRGNFRQHGSRMCSANGRSCKTDRSIGIRTSHSVGRRITTVDGSTTSHSVGIGSPVQSGRRHGSRGVADQASLDGLRFHRSLQLRNSVNSAKRPAIDRLPILPTSVGCSCAKLISSVRAFNLNRMTHG